MSSGTFATIYVVDDDYITLPSEACEQPVGAIYGNDLSTAITAAAADGSSPHTLRVCAGIYNEAAALIINDPDLVNLTIEGALQGLETNLDVDIIGATADIFDVRVDGVTIRDIEITNGRFAIENTAAGTNLTVERVDISNTANDSFRLSGPGAHLIDVTINNSLADGIQANAAATAFTSTNLTINTTTAQCIRLRGLGPHVMTNSDFNNCGTYGVRADAAANNLTINTIDIDTTGTQHCIFIQGDDVTLSDATLSNCGNQGLLININGGGTLLDVSNVVINNTVNIGAQFRNATAAVAGDVIIDDISVTAAGNTGILFRDISQGQVTDLTSIQSGNDGIQIRGGDFTAYGVGSLLQNTIRTSADMGLLVSNDANDNTFNDFLIQDNVDDGINTNNSRRNTFTDMTISINAGTNEDGVVLTNNADINTFDNVDISDTTGDCVRLDSGDQLTYSNSTLIRCGDFGIDASPGAGTTMRIENVDISDTADDGILVQNFIAGDVKIYDVTVTNSGDKGIQLNASSGIELQDFIINTTLSDALIFVNTDNSVIDTSILTQNMISSAGDAAGEHGLELNSGSDGNSIDGINIINTFDDGVNLNASSNNIFNDLVITNPVTASDDGFTVNATSIGNSFTDISANDTVDDCFSANGDDTTILNGTFSNCDDMGLAVNVTAGTALSLTNITVSDTGDDGVFIANFTAVVDVSVNQISVLNSGDRGMTVLNVDGGIFNDLQFQNSTTFGLLLSNADNNLFGIAAISDNIVDNNQNGIQIQNGSDGNTLSNFNVFNSSDNGIIIDASNNNTLNDSDVSDNGEMGILVDNTATNNIFSNNIIVDNLNYGGIIMNTGTNISNSFSNNCFRNTINFNNEETGGSNSFDNGVQGNFWGSLPVNATGFSETCVDDRLIDNDICDSNYLIPGAAGSIDNFPLQKCHHFIPSLTVTKTSQTFNDPINTINHKSIPGSSIRYTLTVDNDNTSRTGMSEDVILSDDLDDEITTLQNIMWRANSMVRTTPEFNSGAATGLTDVTGDDEADFIDTAGNRTVSVICGDLNADEVCILTYEIDVN